MASAAAVPRAAASVVKGKAVIHVAAVVKAAAVAEPMLRYDGARAVHERDCQTPATLVEVACGACVMARVRHMTAMRQAADAPRLVAGRDEVGDQGLKTSRKMAGDRDRPRRGWYRHHPACVDRGAPVRLQVVMQPHFPPLARLYGVTVGAVRGVVMRLLG